jgi:transposase-like protein
MGRKPKYTIEQKVKASEEYLSGSKSAIKIADELNMGKYGRSQIRVWAKLYKVNGSSIFDNSNGNHSYSKEFKEKVVKEYLDGKGSLLDLAAKYDIPERSTISLWIKKYNNHIELKDYNPKTEVYMAKTLKATKEEKIEIVKYCLDHDRDIKGTAEHYGGQYAQIRQWVIKYEEHGEDGLIDRRGKRKSKEQLTDLEKANRRIKLLEKENERQRRTIEILKKASEVERW